MTFTCESIEPVDAVLGREVRLHLQSLGLENPVNGDQVQEPASNKVNDLTGMFEQVLDTIGLDRKDASISGTPKRLAKMYVHECFSGLNYEAFPKCTATPNDAKYDEIVLVRNIELKSMCEHHFMPFIGVAHVAYIPGAKVIGLSKLNRVVQFFGRRPQIQERLTEQVSAAFKYLLGTDDVAVIIESQHLCVKFRGVEDGCSDTVTSKMSGKFKDNVAARQELMTLITSGKK